MENLSSISQSIQNILKSPDAENEETFTELIQSYLGSPDPSVRHIVLEVLNEVISEGSESELQTRRRFIFEQTVLTYLPLLLPLQPDAPELVSSLIKACLEVCSPREAILALNEGCQLLEERAERFDVSDDEGDMEDLPDDHVPESDHGVDLEELVDEFILVINSYTQIFARMPKIKSTPTLFTVSDAVSSAFRSLLPGCNASQATALSFGMAQMIQAAHEWVGRSTDAGGEQRAILTSLLHMSITLLTPRTSSSMTRTWFLSHYPQYVLSRPTPETSEASPPRSSTPTSNPLAAFADTARCLDITTRDLLALTSRDSSMSRVSPFASFSALTLQAYHLSQPPSSSSAVIDLPALDDMLVLLSSGLGGSAMDAAGTLTWEAVHRAKAGDIGFASPLIEILMPLATSDPDDMARLAWYKLIQAIIEKAPAGLDQIMLLEQLLEPANPYDTLRPQALTILRTLLSASSPTTATPSTQSGSTSILQPALLDHLPLLPSAEHLALSTEEFTQRPNGTFVTEQLNTLWVLFELDKENKTGVRGDVWVGKMKASLADVRRKIAEVRREVEGQGELGVEGFMILRLEGAVERLEARIGQ